MRCSTAGHHRTAELGSVQLAPDHVGDGVGRSTQASEVIRVDRPEHGAAHSETLQVVELKSEISLKSASESERVRDSEASEGKETYSRML